MLRQIATIIAISLSAATASAQSALRVDLNIPALKLTVYEGDQVVETYPIAVGMPEFATPTGSFQITHAEWNPWWHPPTHREWARNEQVTPPGPNNPMGRVKLFFLPLYFIHGTPDGESIGTPASHGCVRMLNTDVIELARTLHERAAPQLSERELEALAARPGATRRVNFETAVDVTIRYDMVEVQRSEIFVYPDIYGRDNLHTENVYQALMAAGYDVSKVRHEDVREFVDKSRGSKVPLIVRLDEAFGNTLALAN